MGLNERIAELDKSGTPFEIGACDAGDLSCLFEMYRVFSPKQAAQGLPPADFEVCCNWVRKLLEAGINFLALRNGVVIGHAALVPDPGEKSGEFLIFVDQDFRNLGIGSKLTRVVINKARELSYQSIWLTVENANGVAIKLYRNCGFEFCDADMRERTMLLKL